MSRTIVEVLCEAPLTGSLSAEVRERLASLAELRVLGANEVLWRKGERSRFLGVVLAGRVALSRPGALADNLFDVAREGDWLGEAGFALSAHYTSTVWAPRRARVALLPAKEVRTALEAEPRALSALAIGLATQLSRLLARIDVLSASTVDRRLARTLLSLSEQFGEPFPGGTLIPVRLRRADLASLAATTLETTSRKMSEWERRGYLVTQPAGLLLKDLPALAGLAGD